MVLFKEGIKFAKTMLCKIFLRPLALFFSLFIPPKKKITFFLGHLNSIEAFNGNIKYLFLYIYSLQRTDIDICIVVTTKSAYNLLSSYKLPVYLYPSLKAAKQLLETDIIVVDQGGWFYKSMIYWAPRAKIVQLWHGVGFKIIGKMNHSKLRLKLGNMLSAFPKYDLLISTSEFYTKNLFSKAFNSKKIIESGYPRNDIIFSRLSNELVLIGVDSNMLTKIKHYKSEGKKIVLYAPTFRDSLGMSGENSLIKQEFDFKKFDEFASNNNLIFVTKVHPYATLVDEDITNKFNNIIHCRPQDDIYPLFNYIDMMITDYSSIYMDYLLLNRPVLFFCYDYDEYTTQDRTIQFDYDWITPGPKCKTLENLFYELSKILNGIDENELRRKEIVNMAFRYIDNQSSKRVFEEIEKLFGKVESAN